MIGNEVNRLFEVFIAQQENEQGQYIVGEEKDLLRKAFFEGIKLGLKIQKDKEIKTEM